MGNQQWFEAWTVWERSCECYHKRSWKTSAWGVSKYLKIPPRLIVCFFAQDDLHFLSFLSTISVAKDEVTHET